MQSVGYIRSQEALPCQVSQEPIEAAKNQAYRLLKRLDVADENGDTDEEGW